MPQQIDSYPPHDHSGPAAIESAERKAKIVDLKRKGKSFAQIGAALKISRQRAHEIFHEALRALPQADAADYRAAELDRLEFLREKVQAVLSHRHLVTNGGEVVLHNGRPLVDDMPILKAVWMDIKISERIARLVGADAPVKTENTLNAVARYELIGIDIDDV